MENDCVYKKMTEPFTARIEKQVLNELRKEARINDQSLNSLISQIFNSHVTWHRNSSRAGFIHVRRKLISKLMEKLTEKDVLEIARYVAKNDSHSFISLLRNQYDLTSAIDVVETWIRVSGYAYKHEVKNNAHSFLIHHEMGRLWSSYILEMYGGIFEPFGTSLYEKEMDNNMVTFKINLA